MAYATASQLLDRYDHRLIGDLVSDSGSRVELSSLATDTKLLAALDDASGEVDAALLMGKRYTPTDLSSLTGNSASKLARMTCDIAMAMLLKRRPLAKAESVDRLMDVAEQHIERLRRGEHVFHVAAVEEAGNPSVESMTTVEYERFGLLRDVVGSHYYPARIIPDQG